MPDESSNNSIPSQDDDLLLDASPSEPISLGPDPKDTSEEFPASSETAQLFLKKVVETATERETEPLSSDDVSLEIEEEIPTEMITFSPEVESLTEESPTEYSAEYTSQRAEDSTPDPASNSSDSASPSVLAEGKGEEPPIDGGEGEGEGGDGGMGGAISWMANNTVAANLLMFILIIGGLVFSSRIKQEVFPEITLDIVNVRVDYPGASPEEVEEGIILAIEDAVRGIDGIETVTSVAGEGSANVNAELQISADMDKALSEVQRAVDRITSLPQETERPVVSILSNRKEVVSVLIHGNASEENLRVLGEKVRDDLLTYPGITLVEIEGVRPPEISVEVSQETLRRYNLGIDSIAEAIKQASIDQPAGGMKTLSGEVLVRVDERREKGTEFENITVMGDSNGSRLSVGDLTNVIDGFKDTDREANFDGKRAVRVKVYRVGDQSPLDVSNTVQEYISEHAQDLPDGIEFTLWNDASDAYRDRIDLLLRNAYMGLALVLLILGLFLEIRLAFWVTLGIPISFLGAMLFMPSLDVSLNMISLFAFILTLGIVVDDAIVVGEAVFKHRQDGMKPIDAAIAGAKEVAGPVIFSVLTTIVAFMPMLFVPGTMGKFFKVIPLMVIPILFISLVESLFILPAHLGHAGDKKRRGFLGFIQRMQQKFSKGFEWLIEVTYLPVVKRAISARYLTAAFSIAVLLITAGYVGSGAIKFTFMPKTEGDVITANLRLPFGVPIAETRDATDTLVKAAQETLREMGREDKVKGIYAEVGFSQNAGNRSSSVSIGSHVAKIELQLVPGSERDFGAGDFAEKWRIRVGEMAGVDNLTFAYETGPQGGAAVDIQLSHPNPSVLEDTAVLLAEQLREYPGVRDIDSGVTLGKEQIILRLKDEARSLNITQASLAKQVRDALFGAEAVRMQRGRDELRVYVRREAGERTSEHVLETLLIKTPSGGEIPIAEAAFITRGRAYTQINRRDGRRVINVTADVDLNVTTGNDINKELVAGTLPKLMKDTPDLLYKKAGEQETQKDSLDALKSGFMIAILVMFTLMAVSFKSYIQPLIIMTAIPFGIVGAIIGHILMGFDLSLMSAMGIIALSGVVVNDSLVLISAINKFRKEMSLIEAVIAGGSRRFRPIILTSLTTFFGLIPMIFESSPQARFLIPMAISLGVGILFVTFITLILVPATYMITEDFRNAVVVFKKFMQGPENTEGASEHG